MDSLDAAAGVVEANEEWNSATKLRWYNSLRMLAGAPTG